MADTLRRQTDDFIDVVDLRELIARPPREYSEDRPDHHMFQGSGEAEIIDDRRER